MTKYAINFSKNKKNKDQGVKRKNKQQTDTVQSPKKKIKKEKTKKHRKTNQGDFVCYALFSKCRRRTYIGKTNDLLRRLRQHNGEIKGGAKATKGMQHDHLYFVSGFKDEKQALKFEWRMHHPGGNPRSRRPSGIDGCYKTLLKVCRLKQWTKSSPLAKTIPLTIHYRNHFKDFILKYEKKFPKHIKHEYYFGE